MAKKGKPAKGAKGGKGKASSLDAMTLIGWLVAILLIGFGIVFTLPPAPPSAMMLEEDPSLQTSHETNMKKYDYNGGLWQTYKLGNFFDAPSVAITVGGTLAALMVAFPITSFAKVPKHLKIAIMPTVYNPQIYITQIVEFAKEARMKGLLSLEDKLSETEDVFLKSSLMLVVDSVEPEKVHNLLEAELDHLDERHSNDRAFYDKGGAFAPGFGMIGTLIGLVNMLGDLSDVATLGPNMAVALLTTLYGSMLANLFFSPISNKLKTRHDEEYLCKVLICEGVEAIQSGENPKFIAEKLQMLVIASKSKSGREGKSKRGRSAREAEDDE